MNRYILTENKYKPQKMNERESIWTQGNGYMGVRNSYEEAYLKQCRGIFINGIFDRVTGEVPEIVTLPDCINFEIEINSKRFSMTEETIEEYNSSLNLYTGECERSLVWNSGTDKIKLEFKRIVSNVRKHIIAQQITITPLTENAEIKILTGLDAKVTNTGVQHFGLVTRRAYPDGIKGMYLRTINSNVELAIHSSVSCTHKTEDKVVVLDKRSIFEEKKLNIAKGETVIFEKITSYASSRDITYVDKTAISEQLKCDGLDYLNEARKMKYDGLLTESKAAWNDFWNLHPISIKCENPFYDKALKFAIYHLNIMANEDDSRLGVGAKALTGEGYKGHSFWDTEIFILPYYIFNNPKAARNLLEYRHKLLKSAVEKAKKYGYEGAMYPWEGAWIDDGESSAEFGDIDILTGEARRNMMGELEVHISADVAYGVWQYYLATNDKNFMEKCGYEIIIMTALFWTSRVTEVNGRLEIHNVIGPDEYKDGIDNNAYTNYMAFYNMKLALTSIDECSADTYKRLDELYNLKEIAEKVQRTVDKIYLPKKDKDGIIPQFDGYRALKGIDTSKYKNLSVVGTIFNDYGFSQIQQMQVSKQADLVMLFYLLEQMFSEEEMKTNFAFYEERTLHDSSLSTCIHALIAARLKNFEMADKLFFDACCVDLSEKTNNSDKGIHSASIGGIWLVLAMGYGGLKIVDGKLSVSPVIPNDWKEYEFPIYYCGSQIKVRVDKNGFSVKKISGNPVEIYINGEKTIL